MAYAYDAGMMRDVAKWLRRDNDELVKAAEDELFEIAQDINGRSLEDSIRKDGYGEMLLKACQFITDTRRNVMYVCETLEAMADTVGNYEGNVLAIDAMADYNAATGSGGASE